MPLRWPGSRTRRRVPSAPVSTEWTVSLDSLLALRNAALVLGSEIGHAGVPRPQTFRDILVATHGVANSLSTARPGSRLVPAYPEIVRELPGNIELTVRQATSLTGTGRLARMDIMSVAGEGIYVMLGMFLKLFGRAGLMLPELSRRR